MIYADNAATTRLDKDAFEAMKPFLMESYGNPSQPYSFVRAPKKAVREARETIARCIGADLDEIFFTSGGTESDNWAIKGTAFSDSEKKATITSAFEHHAILNSCTAIERLGYPVVYMRPTSEGFLTADTLKRNITDDTRLVSVMYANNELGTIQPIAELCKIAHDFGALFHTDAVQAVGHIPINVHVGRKALVSYMSEREQTLSRTTMAEPRKEGCVPERKTLQKSSEWQLRWKRIVL